MTGVTRHLTGWGARRELAYLERVRAEASTGDLEAQVECLRLAILPADRLQVRRPIRRWAVVKD